MSLTYIYGVGPTTAKKVCSAVKIDENKKTKDLSNEEMDKLSQDELKKYYEKMKEYYKNKPLDPNLKKQEKNYMVFPCHLIYIYTFQYRSHLCHSLIA